MDFMLALMFLPALVISLSVHEFAHAYSSKLLGDEYAASVGRVSLNPFRHLSLFGTLAIFLIGFGWGKPVPVNLYNFKRPKLYYMLTSLAGPASNLVLAGISLGILYLWRGTISRFIFAPFLVINCILAIINLIPIPPLDGSKIWPCLIPGVKPTLGGKFGWLWIVGLIILFRSGAVDGVLSTSVEYVMKLVPMEVQMYDTRPDGFPESMVAPQRAIGVLYAERNDEEFYDYYMQFSYPEQYPAKDFINEYSTGLTEAGWNRLGYHLFDPNSVADSEWAQVGDEENKMMIYNCSWANDNDEVLMLNMLYEYTDEKKLSDYVTFRAYFSVAGSLISQTLDNYKGTHPDEFQIGSDVDNAVLYEEADSVDEAVQALEQESAEK